MGSCSWPAAVASSPPPPRCCSTCSSGTDTSSFCQISCPVWIGNAKQSSRYQKYNQLGLSCAKLRSSFCCMVLISIYIHLVKTLLSLRFAAIFCPLKYHIHASCSTGKIVCFLTFLLTIGLTIMSKSHYLKIILPILLGNLLGVVPVHLGHGPLDHFLLVSTRMFVFSLTLPFFSCLVTH